ncbi:B-box zinc finger protein [Candidatus Solincola tengchongensis]|uniref:B-box zinc finger protein n=1 Tax=Candidatus Solincola tengchongensis TaxID=2900693 RepID=UPI00257D77A4|nr:B-box zinc finger protein [Candidatus Solincola tengchongensis]
MECPFHAGNEAITACAQCDTPICPLCASETNQVLLCMNCYRSRVEELGAALSSAPARLVKERKKAEAKLFSKRAKSGAVGAPPVEARAAYPTEATRPLWEREELEPLAAVTAPAEVAAAPEEAPLSRKELARLRKEEAKRLKMEKKLAKRAKGEAEAAEVAAAPEEAPLSRKELARLRKEEAKRLKMEKKLAKRAKGEAEAAEVAAAPPPEPAPFLQPPEELAAPAPEREPQPAPAPLPDITFELPLEPEKEGIRLPRLEDRLEFLPPLEEKEEEMPPGLEPPEGFFD